MLMQSGRNCPKRELGFVSLYLLQGNLFIGGRQPQHPQERRVLKDKHGSAPQKPPLKPVDTDNSRTASKEAFLHSHCGEIQTLKQVEARKRWRRNTTEMRWHTESRVLH